MKNLDLYIRNAYKMLNEMKIPYRTVTCFKVKKMYPWGRCGTKNNGKTFYIYINENLLQDDVDDKAIYDTLLHELIHTVKGCFNHQTEWKRYALRLNLRYGLNIKRTTSAKEKNIAIDYKYKVRCTGCGIEIGYMRKNKVYNNIEDYRCRQCKCELERVC